MLAWCSGGELGCRWLLRRRERQVHAFVRIIPFCMRDSVMVDNIHLQSEASFRCHKTFLEINSDNMVYRGTPIGFYARQHLERSSYSPDLCAAGARSRRLEPARRRPPYCMHASVEWKSPSRSASLGTYRWNNAWMLAETLVALSMSCTLSPLHSMSHAGIWHSPIFCWKD